MHEFGARNLEGSGLTSGDNAEHTWAELRPLNRTLKYASSAAARDILQDVVSWPASIARLVFFNGISLGALLTPRRFRVADS